MLLISPPVGVSSRVSLALLAGIFCLAGCAKPAPPGEMPPAQVVSGTPLKLPIVEWDEFVGRLDPINFVEVRARVSGYLDSTNFNEGQIVKKGDLLCVIDPRPFEVEARRAESEIRRAISQGKQAAAQVHQAEAQVQEAEARHDLALKQLARSRKLLQQNAISQDDYDVRDSEVVQSDANVRAAKAQLELAITATVSAEAQVNSAKTSLAAAQLNLEYTQVKAPVTGRVSSRLVTEGNLISGGQSQSTLITTIVSLDPIYCHFDADEMSFLKYEKLAQEGKLGHSRDVKHPVYIGLANEPDQFPHTGYMDFVDNRLDLETGTMRLRAILANPDLQLTPGLFTRVRLPGSGLYDAVLIPDFAVSTDQSEKFVFIIDGDNKIVRRQVKLGPLYRGLRIVREGLDGSENFVMRGQQRVRPGALVKHTPEVFELGVDNLPGDSTPITKEKWLSRNAEEPNEPVSSQKLADESPKLTTPEAVN